MASKIRITDRALARIEPGTGQGDQFVWDSSLAGFGVKLAAGGKRSFVYQFRAADGRTRRMTLGSADKLSASAARDRAEAAQSAVKAGRDPQGEKMEARRAQSIADHAEEWLALLGARVKRGELSARTLEEYASKLRGHILPAFGARKPAEMSARALREWRDATLAKGAAKERPTGAEAVKGALRVLSTFLSHLVEREVIGANPARGLGQFSTTTREKYLSRDDAARLGQALSAWEARAPVWVAALRLALVTGMRKTEVLQLRWDAIREDEDAIVLAVHKTSRTTGVKRLPLTAAAVEILQRAEAWRRPGCPFVFPSQADKNIAVAKGGRLPRPADLRGPASAGGLKRAWTAIRAEAGLAGEDPLRVHDLRHALGSLAASSGVSLPLIGKVLGHASQATTSRYAKVAKDAAAETAEQVSRLVLDRLAQRPIERGSVVPITGRKAR